MLARLHHLTYELSVFSMALCSTEETFQQLEDFLELTILVLTVFILIFKSIIITL